MLNFVSMKQMLKKKVYIRNEVFLQWAWEQMRFPWVNNWLKSMLIELNKQTKTKNDGGEQEGI